MIQAHELSLVFGLQKIFDSLSFSFNQTQRIGLVGRNGSGKSTLLKIIAGHQLSDSGTITLTKNKRIAYFPQEVVLHSQQSIVQETFSAFDEIIILQKKQTELEEFFSTSEPNLQMLEEYSHICEQLASYNIDALQAKTKQMLIGLGFRINQLDEPVHTLSVGWKMRIILAKLLLQEADFYLFDEPTNHLDIVAKDWFLQFLKNASFGFLLVCHERYFLDQLCNHILELEMGKGKLYTGNYSTYEIQKEHDHTLLELAYKNQQREIQQKQETIERFKAKASKAKMAQSMLKALDKVERIELPSQPKTMRFTFPPFTQSGKIVLTVQNVSHTFGDKQIFKNVSFEIKRGQKVALVAANGVGKTTLFNIIAKKIPLQKGTIAYGHNVQYALFDQDQTASLQSDQTIFDTIYRNTAGKTEQTIRTFLGSFLFSNDDIHKKVGVLSGGEKNRVGMVKTLLQDANLLLLDEPTNHLDIPSKDILLTALQSYTGTIIFVSHDHDFVNKLSTDIIELTPERGIYYQGNYDSYKEQKKNAEIIESQKSRSTPSPLTVCKNRDTKKVTVLERKIMQLEQKIETIKQRFENLVYGTDAFQNAQKQLLHLEQEHAHALSEWEQLI